MIPTTILEKIRRIHITTTRLASNTFAGEYKSTFKGRGLEFHEVREYQVGDEIRLIDWNVTARAGKPFIKRHIEERELTVVILLDASASNMFGSADRIKREVAAEVSAVLASSASRNNDKVGLLIFTDRIEKLIPPRKSSHHMLRIIREVLYHKPAGRGTDIPLSLQYLNKTMTRSAIVFLISDFFAKGIKKSLSIASKRHDIVAVKITDPRELELKNSGVTSLRDAETGKDILVDTSVKSVRDEYRKKAAGRSAKIKKLFNELRIDMIDIRTDMEYTDALSDFFRRRKVRRGGGRG
jgi:uncharacterized protein (DUF58 family)